LAEEQRALDTFAAELRAERERGRPPEWVAYEQAVQDYEREIERLKAECGVTAAHERWDAAHETINQVRTDLVDTPLGDSERQAWKAVPRPAAIFYFPLVMRAAMQRSCSSLDNRRYSASICLHGACVSSNRNA
jgi:hypothetical protein